NNPDFFSVGDTALDAASPIRKVIKPAILIVVGNFIMGLGTAGICDPHALSDLDGLHCIDTHYSLGEAAIQACIPTDMRPQTNRNASRHDFKSPADCIAIFLST